ncbi:GntR family transcriptional regulator [Kutzneria buriramensis]|uniref:DNA-binding GntR family transcriptional regulator n=1 Tax=Kutzneria buriramensis TaxID=1045776 RepID=A0A3E0I6H6_9PSEU|nr:GntR family transcriptional regulator [Kutzneria buriramensis]REH54354.1 DNA-binding GntR family transcriptional regulator [Kutzneria buriramensis]
MARSLSSRPQLSDEVAAHLREAIMSGALQPGQFVRLDAVAAELGVSVTPVREALLALRGEDMVELEPRRGFVVSPLSRRDVKDMFGLQADLAAQLVGRAAERITDEQLAHVERVAAELAAAAGHQELSTLEYEFHRLINKAAGSRKLARFLDMATRYTPARVYTGDPEWRVQVVADHAAILDALRARDVGAAREAVFRHVKDGERRLLRHLDAVGMWPTR